MSQLSKIRSSLKCVKDSVVRERLLMVCMSYEMSFRSVGERFGCSEGRVRFWRRRYEWEGLQGLRTRPRSGRPPKMSGEASLKVRESVSKHDVKRGWRTKRIRQVIYEETGVLYSERQVIRIAQSWGLAQITPRPRSAYARKEEREAFVKKTVAY